MGWLKKLSIFFFFTKKIGRNIPRPTGVLKIGRGKSGDRFQTALVTIAPPFPLSIWDLWVQLIFLPWSNYNWLVWTWPACRMPWRLIFSPFHVDLYETAVAVWVHRLYGFCDLLAAFRRLYRFLRTYMACALYAACAYKYVFACKAAYCVRIQLMRSMRLMRTDRSLRVKRLIAYVYKLCAWNGLCIRINLCA